MQGLISFFVGALLLTGLLTRGTNWLLRKKINEKTTVIISFLLVAIICLLLAGFRLTFYIYIPCLLLWLLFDLRKASKKPQKNREIEK